MSELIAYRVFSLTRARRKSLPAVRTVLFSNENKMSKMSVCECLCGAWVIVL